MYSKYSSHHYFCLENVNLLKQYEVPSRSCFEEDDRGFVTGGKSTPSCDIELVSAPNDIRND